MKVKINTKNGKIKTKHENTEDLILAWVMLSTLLQEKLKDLEISMIEARGLLNNYIDSIFINEEESDKDNVFENN